MSGLKRNIVATVPSTLAEGHEVFVGSGTQYTHYIGNASNVPIAVKGYLEYEGVIEQSSTSAPTEVHSNVEDISLGTFSRIATGIYTLTMSTNMSFTKTVVYINNGIGGGNVYAYTGDGNTNIQIRSKDDSGSNADSVIENAYLNVKLYY